MTGDAAVEAYNVKNLNGKSREAAGLALFMDDGYILEDGTPDELFAHPKHPRMRGFLGKVL